MSSYINTMNNNNRQYHPNNNNNNNLKDVEQVRRIYKAALSELTFNSKPIITNLTIMAQENQQAASVIVREIENQLRSNPPGQKLPVLYLIDSICKNVGNVYIIHFARNMVNNYLDAYTLSDPTVKKSFERLLQTWKNGMPGGQPVFSRHVIEPIERSILYIREKTPTSNNPNIHVNPHFLKDQPSPIRDPRSHVKQENTVPPKIASPQSSSSALLTQLQSMLPNSMPNNYPLNDPITQIIGQIKAILPTLPPAQAASIEKYLSQIVSASPTVAPSTLNTPALNTSTLNTPTPTLSHPGFPIVSTPPPVTASPKVDTANLLKSLTSMGLLKTKDITDLNQFGPFLLDSKDLQIARPGAIELLYSAEPLQCKQCGFRYPQTEKGQAKMDAHLDSHFRQNRKMKERTKRGLSRSWFVTVDEWVSGEGGELTSQQAPAFLHDSHAGTKSTENQQKNEDVINPDENTVIMPDEDHRKPCAICGERFVDFWNDDEEEWMYKNAIMVNDKIYHATCYADAVKSGALANIQDVHNLKRKINQQDEQVNKIPRLQ